MKTYAIDIRIYNRPGVIESNCNAIAITITGSQSAVINGVTFPQGAAISIDGHAGEEDKTVYNLSFTGAGSPAVLVVRKIYQS